MIDFVIWLCWLQIQQMSDEDTRQSESKQILTAGYMVTAWGHCSKMHPGSCSWLFTWSQLAGYLRFYCSLECVSWPRDGRTGLLLIRAVFVLSRSRLRMTLLIPDNKSLQEWGSDHQPHYPEPPAVALHQHCSTLSSQETGQILSGRISWQARTCSELFVNNCVQLTCSISDTTHKLPQVSLRF